MKIALLTTQIPFIRGGAEMHVENLRKALEAAGHQVEIITVPFNDGPISRIEDHIVAMRLLDVSESWGGRIDLAIGMKFPAYLIPHPNKVMWILHQHRQAYDLFGTEFSNFRDDDEGRRLRDIITKADEKYLAEAKHIFANSGNVSKRLKKFCGLNSTPLYHPCPDMDKFYCKESEDYLLMPSRINTTKRQSLALQALSKTSSNVKLYIVGAADNDEMKKWLMNNIAELGLTERVKYLDFVEQDKKIELYANCRGVVFIPKDEDYGYITLEAMASSKPVITCTDSGGPLEFVDNGVNGFVCDPDPESIAAAMDKLGTDKKNAIIMGQEAKAKIVEKNISWEHVVSELLKFAD